MSYSQPTHQVQAEELKPAEGLSLPETTQPTQPNNNLTSISANHNDKSQKKIKIIEKAYKNGFNVILHDSDSKKPLWLGMSAATYQADLHLLLNELKKNPDLGYGVVVGEQLEGKFGLVAIDIDIDTEDCKEGISREIESRLTKHAIHYYKERTKSNRIHYYILLDKITEEIEKISKLPYPFECFKYKNGNPVPGEIELFAKKNRYIIIYDEDPCISVDTLVFSDHLGFIDFLNKWMEDFADEPTIEDKEPSKEPIKVLEIKDESEPEIEEDESIYFSKIVEAYKIIRNHNIVNGWEIEKVFSAYCIREDIAIEQAIEGFKAIYGSEYDEKRTIRLLENTKKKDLKLLPNPGSVYYHITLALDSKHLNEHEKELLETVLDDLKNIGYSNYQMPDYLKNAENVYLYKSSLKVDKNNKPYYKESYFIEQNIDGTKLVVYVSIIASNYKGIYKLHKLEHEKDVGIKAEVIRGIKEGKFEDYEYLLNDEIIYRPSFNFTRVDDLVNEMVLLSMKYSKFFDVSLYKQYLGMKTRMYRTENNNPPPCVFSKVTGWSDDLKLFFHPCLNDNYHELHSDHVLHRLKKDLVIEKDKQHELVKAILHEGKLLAVLLTASVSSLLIRPLDITGITYVISGMAGVGKTTSSLIATSLFYNSNDHLIDAHITKTALELMIASLNSLPILIDEGSLAGANYTLQDLIFMVSSGKGKTRGKKDLSLDFRDLKSNIFWTTETTDIDELRRSGAFRRMLYIVARSWNDFTSLFDAKDRVNVKYSGCGIDYIKYLIEHMEDIKKAFEESTKRLNTEYGDISLIALNIYGGLILLEAFYNTKFNALRKTINKLLNEAKARFIDSRDNVVMQVLDYLESIAYQKFHIIDKNNEDEIDIQISRNETYGEYDKINGIYYVSGKGIKEIADKLGKNRYLLLDELEKAKVLIDRNVTYYTRATKQRIKVYKLKFSELETEQISQEKTFDDLEIPF